MALSALAAWSWLGKGGPPPLPVKQVLRGAGEYLIPLAFSPDGSMLATRDDKHRLTVWDIETGRPARSFKGPANANLVAFSPDGGTVAWMAPGGNGRGIPHLIYVADVGSGEELARLELDKPILFDMAFLGDGSTFRVIG